MHMSKIFSSSILFLLFFGFNTLYAQSRILRGIVTETGTEIPIPGAHVKLSGSSTANLTDIDGSFSMLVAGAVSLEVSYIGYDSKVVDVSEYQTEVRIELAEGIDLGEVVVTALGIKRAERSLGYAMQNISAGEITKTGTGNLLNALQGQVSGVHVSRSGGGAGQGSQIFIRGISSLDPGADNQPLFVIDGVPIDNSTQESSGRLRGMSNRAIDINPNDIESVSVLKSAPATALYGVRAANGAVIITTKQGKSGEVRIDYSGSASWQDVVNFPDYQNVFGPGFGFVSDPNGFWPAWGAAYSTTPELTYYNNWENAMRTGFSVDNSLSVSGGNETARFYTSLASSLNKGVIPNNNWNRTSLRASGELTKGKFTMTSGVSFINSGGNRVPFVNFMERLAYWNTSSDVTDWRFEDGTMKADNLSGRGSGRNPIYDAETNTYVDDVNRFIGSINASYKLNDWISVNYLAGMDIYSDQRTEIEPGPLGLQNEFVWSEVGGFREENRINNRDLTSNLSLFVRKKLSNEIIASLRVGNDIFDRQNDLVRARGSDFVTAGFSHFSNARNVSIGQKFMQKRLVGIYGDLNLDWKDVVYLNVTGRNDWTSTLSVDNRSFFYPSVNMAVILNEIFHLPAWLSYTKLSLSYAEVGKDAPPYATQQVYYSPSIYPVDEFVGFSGGKTIASPGLRPERTISKEMGLDLRFFRNKYGLVVNFYQARSKDMIIPVPVSSATGSANFITNAGEIKNQGVELTLRVNVIETTAFKWNLISNFTSNSNKVISIREGVDAIFLGDLSAYLNRPFMQLVPGQSYGAIWGTSYKRYGADPSSVVLDKDLPLLIGENGFPVVDNSPKILGDALPDRIWNVYNNFSYKSWDMSFNIDFVSGIEKYNKLDQWDAAFGHTTKTLNRTETIVFEGLTADGKSNTKAVYLGQGISPVDGINYGAGYHRDYYRPSVEQSVQDASYIKLRSLSLGYSLSETMLKRLPFSAFRASVTMDNIILWTPWSHYDPEAFSSSGSNLFGLVDLAYPGTRSIVFSIQLSM